MFCMHGGILGKCKKCGNNPVKWGDRPPKRDKIGDWSGKSKNKEYALNWRAK